MRDGHQPGIYIYDEINVLRQAGITWAQAAEELLAMNESCPYKGCDACVARKDAADTFSRKAVTGAFDYCHVSCRETGAHTYTVALCAMNAPKFATLCPHCTHYHHAACVHHAPGETHPCGCDRR